MTKEEYVEAKQAAVEMRASGQSNILLVQPLLVAPATSPPPPAPTPTAPSPISVIPSAVEAQPAKEEEDVTVISELSIPALTRRSTRTSPSII